MHGKSNRTVNPIGIESDLSHLCVDFLIWGKETVYGKSSMYMVNRDFTVLMNIVIKTQKKG